MKGIQKKLWKVTLNEVFFPLFSSILENKLSQSLGINPSSPANPIILNIKIVLNWEIAPK